MKKFNITVNGKTYEVDVEEVGGIPSAPQMARPAAPAPQAQAAAPAPAAKAAPAPKKEDIAVSAGASKVESPMPGTILDIKVKVGDSVSEGDVLMILEAMKMENEIMAPTSGKVASINANKGASVDGGDVLVVIE